MDLNERMSELVEMTIKAKLNCFIVVYEQNSTLNYNRFLNEVNDVLQKAKLHQSSILLGDFNANVGTDSTTGK